MFAKTFVSVAPLNDTSEIPSFVKHVITKRGIDPDPVYRDEISFCHLTARLPRSKYATLMQAQPLKEGIITYLIVSYWI